MSGRTVLTCIVAALAVLTAVPGLAQDNDPEQQTERQRAEEAEAAVRLDQVRRQLAAQEAEVSLNRSQVVARERELERARRELERARREMEAAARQITRLSAGPNEGRFRVAVEPFGRLSGQGRIGATIQNADNGALILAVTPGGAADEAGIMSGDVITSVNGVEALQLGRAPTDVVISTLADADPGTIVPIELLRAGEAMTFDVEIQEPAFTRFFRNLPGNVEVIAGETAPVVRDMYDRTLRWLDVPGIFASRWRDMELVTLTEDLGRYFGTDTGLLVVRAPGDEEIGLRDGDVILGIGGRTPTSPEHAMRILTSFVPGETVEFTIMRNERRRTIEYTIPGTEED